MWHFNGAPSSLRGMSYDTSTLNLSRYRTLSSITLAGSISAGKGLIELAPEEIPDDEKKAVEKALNKLAIAIDAAGEAMSERLDDKADLRLERLFDLLVDRVWVSLRARLDFWHCYDHEGVNLLSNAEQIELDIEGGRKLAAAAKELHDRLFGEGLEFLRLPYPQQASHMAARLLYIESHGLGPQFVELVGARPIALAKVCQRRYEAMVSARSARDNTVSNDLRPLRMKIANAAEKYANVLLATLDDYDEAWAEIVLTALRPMLGSDRARSHGEAEEAEAAEPDPLIDEPDPLDPIESE